MKDRDDDKASDAKAPEADVDETEADIWADLTRQDQEKPEDADEPSDEAEGDDPPENEDTKGDELEALRAQTDRLVHQLESEKGRSVAQQRRAERLANELAKAREGRPDDDDDDDDTGRKGRDERLKAATEEYSDVLSPVVDEINDLRSKLDSVSKSGAEDAKKELADLVAEETGLFMDEHPDGFKVLDDNMEAFSEWIEDQPKKVRDMFAANRDRIVNGVGAAFVVSRFKQNLYSAVPSAPHEKTTETRLKSRRQQQIDGAQGAPSKSRGPVVGEIPADADDDAGHWEYFKRLDERRARQA